MSQNKKEEWEVGDCVMDSQKRRYTIVKYSKSIELKGVDGNIVSLDIGENYIKVLTEDDIQFAYESITEMIDFAKKTLQLRKSSSEGGGLYGVSIAILIACAFDAMGRIALDKKDKKSDTNRQRFQCIQDDYINNGNYGFQNDDFVNIFYQYYRCGLVHSGTITQNYTLSADKSKDCKVIQTKSGQTTIFINELILMAEDVFKHICTECDFHYSGNKFLNTTVTGDTKDYRFN